MFRFEFRVTLERRPDNDDDASAGRRARSLWVTVATVVVVTLVFLDLLRRGILPR